VILALLPDWLDPARILETGSYLLLFAIIFAETGLLVGFFLPGDSLLFTAGVFAARGDLNIAVVAGGCFVAAVLGDQTGYVIGQRAGPALFRRPDARFFRQAHVQRAQHYFDQHGPKTIVIARFVPIVRTFTPVLAGVGKMDYRRFVTYNVAGALLWAVGVTLLGFLAGEAIGEDKIDRYLLPIIALIIAASFVPVLREYRRNRRQRPSRTSSR
jgi:membrane-associated protein